MHIDIVSIPLGLSLIPRNAVGLCQFLYLLQLHHVVVVLRQI